MADLAWIQYTDKMVGRGHPSLPDTLNAPLREVLSDSGYDPDADQFPGLYGPVFNVKALGAVGDGVTDDTVACQLAISSAVTAGGGTIFFPRGSYRITASLTVITGQSKLAFVGVGRSASKLVNAIVGNPADPLLKITAAENYFLIQGLWFNGNGLTGASGNGHAIALINLLGGGTYWPQQVMIRDCIVDFHLGNGKDNTGASIPACGVYAYGLTGAFINNTSIYTMSMGVRLSNSSKVYMHQCSVDVCTNACAYVDQASEAIDFVGTVFNGSGSAGAKDGLVYLNNCSGISIVGCRLKNGNPCLVNVSSDVAGAGVTGLLIEGCSCQQFSLTSGHTAFLLGNAVHSCVIQANAIDFVNTITDGIGVSVVQIAAGYDAAGLIISGNAFNIGIGGTLASGIKLNVTSNKVVAPVIEGNVFGRYDSGGRTITSAIELRGVVDAAALRGNTFVAIAGDVITNAIQLVNGTITNLFITQNVYRAFGGTITNQIAQSGGVPYTRLEGGQLLLNGSGGAGPILADCYVGLTDAATIAVDASAGNIFVVTLGGNRTMGAPTNPTRGQTITFEIVQDGTGGRTLAWNAAFKQVWSDTGNTLGKRSTISFFYNTTNWVQVAAQGPYV